MDLIELAKVTHKIEDYLEIMQDEIKKGKGLTSRFDSADSNFKDVLYLSSLPQSFVKLYEESYDKIISDLELTF